ncbi:kelch-like protein 9 [Bicyclus anynana]|uniref:Kelch-like protein 9 n=1 Tax=Bicyclus anynana TaxID=110368 RepID=A0A6J1PAR1_BICAN|nr:kelch-like protein 9 [Bicyclus anynana]
MTEITLRIGEEVFQIKKELLCEYSDYFRAMFSGYYVESDKQEINIDMLDPYAMKIILKYMEMGNILLSEYPLTIIDQIAVTADFLQIRDLTKQIQHVLDIQLSESNWLDTMTIAQKASYTELEQLSAAYGLYNFNSMETRSISTIHILIWYLSHPYLDSQDELQIFKFGLLWLYRNLQVKDNVLLILACLDMKRVTNKTLLDIRDFSNNYSCGSLFLEIISCLLNITSKGLDISESSLCEHKEEICEKFTERVWCEALSIVKDSRPRLLKYVPVVPTQKNILDEKNMLHVLQNFVCTLNEDRQFEKLLEVADKEFMDWKVAAWGPTKLVVLCGFRLRFGSGIEFMQDVMVYDTLRNQLEKISAQLPQKRFPGVTIVGDLLYILGGLCENGFITNTTIVYNLRERKYISKAKLPEIHECPVVCTHHNRVYIAGGRHVYCYIAGTDVWKPILDVHNYNKLEFMKSYNGYIYCMAYGDQTLYRFKPGIEKALQSVTSLTNMSTAICVISNNSLMVFTKTDDGKYTVEEHNDRFPDEQLIVHPVELKNEKIYDPAGSCSLVMSLPPLCKELSQYHRHALSRDSLDVVSPPGFDSD